MFHDWIALRLLTVAIDFNIMLMKEYLFAVSFCSEQRPQAQWDKNMSSLIWIKMDDDLHHIDALIT